MTDCNQGVVVTQQAIAYPIPAGGARKTINLPPQAGVKQWSVMVMNRDTVGAAAPVNLFFAIQPSDNMLGNLNQAQGDYLTPGNRYRATLPGNARTVTLDLAGLQQDFVTPDAVVAIVVVKACGGGPGIPNKDAQANQNQGQQGRNC